MKKTRLTCLLLAAVGSAWAAGSAWATPTIRVTTDAGQWLVADQGNGDFNPIEGALATVLWLPTDTGIFGLEVVTGATKPYMGTATAPKMSLNVQTSALDGGHLQVEFSEQFYGPLDHNLWGQFISSLSSSNHQTTALQNLAVYYDLNNILFGTTSKIADLSILRGGLAVSENAFSSTFGTGTSPFSLTLVANIDQDGHTFGSSLDASVGVSPVPAPATLLLLSSGLAGLLGLKRKNRA